MMIKKQDWNPENESKTEKNVFLHPLTSHKCLYDVSF